MKKKGGAMNNPKKQLTNCGYMGALGCAFAHLFGASAPQACAVGTCAALSSAKARKAIDTMFSSTKVVSPDGNIFKNKIEYYKTLLPDERIEMLSLMTKEDYDYLYYFNQPEYQALTYIDKERITPTYATELELHLDNAKKMAENSELQKFEWRLCPCGKDSSKCPKEKGLNSSDVVLRFVPFNGMIRNPYLISGWGFPYGTDNAVDTSRYYPKPEERVFLQDPQWGKVSMNPPGARFGGSYLKKKFSKKNRIKKKKKSKKN